MGIRCYCPQGHKLNVKAEQAGKIGICPKCRVRFQIPLESTRPSHSHKSEKVTPAEPEAPASVPSAPAPAESESWYILGGGRPSVRTGRPERHRRVDRRAPRRRRNDRLDREQASDRGARGLPSAGSPRGADLGVRRRRAAAERSGRRIGRAAPRGARLAEERASEKNRTEPEEEKPARPFHRRRPVGGHPRPSGNSDRAVDRGCEQIGTRLSRGRTARRFGLGLAGGEVTL